MKIITREDSLFDGFVKDGHRSRAQAGGLLDGGEAFLPFRPGLQIHRLPKRQGRRGARGDRAVLFAGGGDPPAGRREI